MSAAFVQAMREAFGEENIQVIYVKEGEVEIGKPDQDRSLPKLQRDVEREVD